MDETGSNSGLNQTQKAMENNSISVEFDNLLRQDDERISDMLACVAYHSAVNKGNIEDWGMLPGQTKPATTSTIDRLLSEFQLYAGDEYKVGRGGDHIWVSYPDNRRVFAVMFRKG